MSSRGWRRCRFTSPSIFRVDPAGCCRIARWSGMPDRGGLRRHQRSGRGAKMSRYREIAVAEMDPAQKRVHDQIVSGKRGRFGGPFQLLIRAPGVCEHAAPLGEYLRWGTSLPDRLSELAILT